MKQSVLFLCSVLMMCCVSARAATFVVTNAAGSGPGTLRQAILDANANPGLDGITFAIPGPGVHTIAPMIPALPEITDPVIIDGTTQPGYASKPLIEIRGAGVGDGGSGLTISAGSSGVLGLAINHFSSAGIWLRNKGSNVIAGNFLGTDPAGTTAVPNDFGIEISAGSSFNTIGGANPEDGNVLSGNRSSGLAIAVDSGGSNVVVGNFIGTDVTGGNPLPNDWGIALSAPANTIGGTDASEANVISGNRFIGVLLDTEGATGNQVQGNFIGTDPGGTFAVPNANGIVILDAPANTIGGAESGAGNVISGNARFGINLYGTKAVGNVIQGNFIGTARAGTNALPNGAGGMVIYDTMDNLIGGAEQGAGNLISGNGGSGIWLLRATNIIAQGNFIGTDATGASAIPNLGSGILLTNSPDNLIGGTESGAGNLISGNVGAGIELAGTETTGNSIAGNFIGTALDDRAPLGNGKGVLISDAPSNQIGGTDAGWRNVISGNVGNGIEIQDADAIGNVVQGNFIGSDAAGLAKVGNGQSGVFILAASENTIGGTEAGAGNLISGNIAAGIAISSEGPTHADGNVIQGNWVGTDVSGAASLGNEGEGVSVTGDNTTIGGGESGARNVIAASGGPGISLFGTNNVVQGNFIGTDVSGTKALPNGKEFMPIVQPTGGSFPIALQHYPAILATDSGHTIGGATSQERNVISGNLGDGIALVSRAMDCQVVGNFIGADVSGVLPLPNAGAGVLLSGSAVNNLIGAFSPGEGNRIAFNGGDGILIRELGTRSNSIVRNSIFSNGGLGINLQPGGEPNSTVTPNDNLDADSGPNNLQNFPLITNVVYASGSLKLQGYLRGKANGNFDLDFFSNSRSELSGFGEGENFLGTKTVDTDETGFAAFEFIPGGSFSNQFFTATATDGDTGDTSEFSEQAGGLVIRSIQPVGADVRLGFTTTLGRNYKVERSSTLGPPANWAAVNGAENVPGTGGIVSITDLGGGSAPTHFYRVRQLP